LVLVLVMKEIVEDGTVYWIGENAADNWDTLVLAKKQKSGSLWLWFHLDNMSSAYVIVCKTRQELKDTQKLKQTVSRAADLCKSNGKYRDLPKASVIYTELKNIKKGTNVGQVIVSGKTDKVVV